MESLSLFARYGLLALALLGLTACDLLHEKPSAQEAQVAISAWVQEAGLQSQNVPAGFQLAKIVMKDCVWQESPEGQVCSILLVSNELPILGAVSVPVQLRFAKRQGVWKAYLL
jgi:hypothetical protein